jgi:hypothetical protein
MFQKKLPLRASPASCVTLFLIFVLPLMSCGSGGGGGSSGCGNGSSGVNVLAQFDGDSGIGNPPTYKDHPDMAIAANGTQVIETTGQNINVYSYAGAILSSTPVSSFITQAIGTVGKVNDPRIVYDPFISRWLFVCSCSANYLIVSGTSDATGSWKGLSLSSDSGDLLMSVGFDKNGVYVSETDATGTGKLFAMPNADVGWTGSGTISLAHEAIAAGQAFQMPAVDLNPGKGLTDPEYFLSHSPIAQKGSNVPLGLLVAAVNWSGLPSNPTASFSFTNIPTNFLYNTPVNAGQPASPNIRGTESHRVFGVYSHAGQHLYAVVGSGPCVSNCGSQGADSHNLFFFFDVNTPVLSLNQGVKVSNAQCDLLFPSLAVDSRGNIAMAATGSSSGENPSVYEWHQLATDGAGTVHGPNLLTAGSHSYSCVNSPVGWGTYSTTAQDGGDGTKLWTVQEYGNSSTPCNWTTRSLEFKVVGP